MHIQIWHSALPTWLVCKYQQGYLCGCSKKGLEKLLTAWKQWNRNVLRLNKHKDNSRENGCFLSLEIMSGTLICQATLNPYPCCVTLITAGICLHFFLATYLNKYVKQAHPHIAAAFCCSGSAPPSVAAVNPAKTDEDELKK